MGTGPFTWRFLSFASDQVSTYLLQRFHCSWWWWSNLVNGHLWLHGSLALIFKGHECCGFLTNLFLHKSEQRWVRSRGGGPAFRCSGNHVFLKELPDTFDLIWLNLWIEPCRYRLLSVLFSSNSVQLLSVAVRLTPWICSIIYPLILYSKIIIYPF